MRQQVSPAEEGVVVGAVEIASAAAIDAVRAAVLGGCVHQCSSSQKSPRQAG